MRLTGSYQRRWLITPSFDSAGSCRREHRVAIAQAGRQRFFDQNVHSRPGGLDRRLGMERVRSRDAERLDAALVEHARHVVVRLHAEARSK